MTKNLKRIVAPIALVALTFGACKKADKVDPLGDNGAQIMRVVKYGGVANDFTNSSISYPDPTATSYIIDDVQLEYSSSKVATTDITLKVAVDMDYVAKYNATQTNPLNQYEEMPATAYTFAERTVTIKAGQSLSETFSIEFHPDQIDPAVNLMVPIRITAMTGAPGEASFASSSSVAYFHHVGNPLAGNYHSLGYFYHPSLPRDIDMDKSVDALTATTMVVELGDLGGSGYYATFEVADPGNTTTVQPVNITVYPGSISPIYLFASALPSANPGYTPAWPRSAECNNTYDPTTKSFKVRYGYLGGTGYRVTEEIITKL